MTGEQDISRRSLLGAAFALSAIAAPATAIAVTNSQAEVANAKFWRLNAEREALERQWSAVPEDDDEGERRVAALADAKFDEAMMQPVDCPLAVLAKLKMTHFGPQDYSLPYPAESAAKMIEADLQRCAARNLAIGRNL